MEQLREKLRETSLHLDEIFVSFNAILINYGLTICKSKPIVEDSLQDLFLKFCENESLILNADHKLAYLKTSLRRNILKKLNQASQSLDSSMKFREISVPSYEDLLIKKQDSIQQSLRMKEAISHLSKSQKTILTMRFYRSMSYDDIAGKLGISKRTVYNQIHDSIKKIRSSYT